MQTTTDTQVLLQKITALRQRLEQAQGTTREITSAVAKMAGMTEEEIAASQTNLRQFLRRVEGGGDHDFALDAAVRPLGNPADARPRDMPVQLTARARGILERGRELLGQLRALANVFAPVEETGALFPRHDPLARLYRRLVALATTGLRAVSLLPDTATAQLPLCEGPEALLEHVTQRVRVLEACVHRRKKHLGRLDGFAGALRAVERGTCREITPFVELTERLIEEADEGEPVTWHQPLHEDVENWVAAHSLNVAQVVARVARRHHDFRHRLLEPIVASLLLDVGMLHVPLEILKQQTPLDDEQRRIVESHCRVGADLVTPLQPDANWLHHAVLMHHERLDGTGYPDGLRDFQLPPISQLLPVCDVYAALASPRPHRAAFDTRTAMTDTLLMAEQGLLDRDNAQLLLHLSFYPVGMIVELSDGSIGAVTAAPTTAAGPVNPARPVVALLLDAQGTPVTTPRHLDLAQTEGVSILRTLSPNERLDRLGSDFPEWVS